MTGAAKELLRQRIPFPRKQVNCPGDFTHDVATPIDNQAPGPELVDVDPVGQPAERLRRIRS